jgi:peptidoglycan/LPS O-acetylase OafA/YrhL
MDAIALGCLTAIFEIRVCLSNGARLTAQVLGILLMILVLGFSTFVESGYLMRAGLDMTIVAFGTCLVMLAIAKGNSRVPTVSRPLLWLGRRSYEVYLTHMFVVIGVFVVFTKLGKPLAGVPILFITAILISGPLGEIVGRFYSEPMNHILRMRMVGSSNKLGAAIEASELTTAKRSVVNAG